METEELRDEITALKTEVSQLKSALHAANLKLEHCEKVATDAQDMQRASTMKGDKDNVPSAGQRGRSNRRSNGRHKQATASTGSQAIHAAPASAAIRRKPSVPVRGKRKLWGTRKTTTTEDVIRTINTYTSVKTGLTVKRKYKSTPRYPHAITKWWFVVSGEENLLQQLHGEWSKITQTEGKWSLESLLCYPESTSTDSNCHDGVSPANNMHPSPNPSQESDSTTLTTMDPNAVTPEITDPSSNQ